MRGRRMSRSVCQCVFVYPWYDSCSVVFVVCAVLSVNLGPYKERGLCVYEFTEDDL